MNTIKIRKRKYPPDMDGAMIPLCDTLNSMRGIVTEESCEGHGRDYTDVFFTCTDWVSLAKVQRAIDIRYGGLYMPWELETVTVDVSRRRGYPPVVFHLHSKHLYPLTCRKKMFEDLAKIVLNLELYHSKYFERYFKAPNRKHGDIPDETYGEYRRELEALEKGR